MAYTAFGERRKGDWRVSDPLPPIIPALTNRGFTGHEHIDEMGLIHMNIKPNIKPKKFPVGSVYFSGLFIV
jgi:hypothetical protein